MKNSTGKKDKYDDLHSTKPTKSRELKKIEVKFEFLFF